MEPTQPTEPTNPPPQFNDTELKPIPNENAEPPEQHSNWRYLREKYVYIPLIIIIFIPLFGLIDANHYAIFGVLFKQNYSVVVLDSKTGEPLKDATLTMRGQTVSTNTYGEAVFPKIKVGDTKISLTKTYYSSATATVLVPLTNHKYHVFLMKSVGPDVAVSVSNYINNVPIKGVVVTIPNDSAITGTEGYADIVTASKLSTVTATLMATGYNPATVTINSQSKNSYTLVPSGKVYYLGGQNGAVNIMSANLDGSGQQVLLAGNSYVTTSDTSVYASNDSNYLAVFTTRDDSGPAFYIFNTATDKLTLVSRNANGYKFIGWTKDNNVVYEALNNVPNAGQYGGTKLMDYNVLSKTNSTLDICEELGYDVYSSNSQTIGAANLLPDGTIIYTKTWNTGAEFGLNGDSTTVNAINYNGKTVNVLLSLNAADYPNIPQLSFVGPNSFNLAFTNGISHIVKYYSYSGGKLTQTTSSSVEGSISSPTVDSLYYTSPNSDLLMWSSPLNSSVKSFNVAGSGNTSSPSSITKLAASFSPLGWSSNNYILVTQNSNEIYVLPASGLNNQNYVHKVVSYLQ